MFNLRVTNYQITKDYDELKEVCLYRQKSRKKRFVDDCS